MGVVTFTCLTTKKTFDVENPPVIQLANGRYAYRVPCPWEGKNGKQLHAFKFAPKTAWTEQEGGEGEPVKAPPGPTDSDSSEASYSSGEPI